jgi:N-acetylglutamate synthase-like GNAT family acetyltransferase
MLVTLTLRELSADTEDWSTFASLLTLAGLPTSDLHEGGRFVVVEDEVGLVGFGGLEGSGPDQLIRSVVVTPGLRRRGMGPVVVRCLVDQARRDGAKRLWLLTTEADGYFGEQGWVAMARDRAPDSVRASRLYQDLCPATAVLMVRSLA